MSTALEMSASAESGKTSETSELDRALAELDGAAAPFLELPIREKRELLRRCMDGVIAEAEQWTASGARAKGLADPSEEWAAGPLPTMRNLRLLSETLEKIERRQPIVDGSMLTQTVDGRVAVKVFPTSKIDAALFAGITCEEHMQEGLSAGDVQGSAGALYKKKDPEPGVSLILGAGNVSSIPPMDALYKLFAEGLVTVVKMNPVNEWVGPHIERAFAPLVERGFLKIVYGGADVGKYLLDHDTVKDIHITGSNFTHDNIVWGPAGPERERRMADNDPVLKKRITSELGNVSPVAIVPGKYDESELDFMAKNVASMVTNNASFNCNAAKMLITSQQWPDRQKFLDKLSAELAKVPTRKAYYPGAFDRYDKLTNDRDDLRKIGSPADGELPWTIIPEVDPSSNDALFTTEPFCGILSQTSLDAATAGDFIEKATAFMNDTLWGTLNATWIIHPKEEDSSEVGGALDRAITQLRYGSVTVNHWPALVYATCSPTWGGHPSATLANVQSGLGWVHNTYLLEGVEKAVLRGPLKLFPKPLWFHDNKKVVEVVKKMLQMERDPSWLKLPGVALTALGG